MDTNVTVIVGRLTNNPETRKVGEHLVSKFRIACNRSADGVDYIPVVAWNKLAELCEQYLQKGARVSIVGKLRSGKYEKDGKVVFSLDLEAKEIQFLSKAEKAQEQVVNTELLQEIEEDDDMPF